MFWLPVSFLFYTGVFKSVLGYIVARDYSGSTFFDEWDFFGSYDNLTHGDVWWLNRNDAFNQGLAFVNNAGRAVIKVDNTHYVPYNQKRNSIRITSKHDYGVGSLWVIDVAHLPYGCSVWPAFWTKGPLWPDDGEIDIIEAINRMPANQMALHTLPGCMHTTPPAQTGRSGELNCSVPSGCLVAETAPNSFGPGFAQAGGGVWATQFDINGVFIWFWSRANVPASIAYSTSTSPILDVTQWGAPSASFPATSCNMTNYFSAQNLVLDITLCGVWAGIGPAYNASCGSSGPSGLCYNDLVVGPGSTYDNAFFEINYVRAYTTGVAMSVPTATTTRTATTTFAPITITENPIATALFPSPLFFSSSENGSMSSGFTRVSVGFGIFAGLVTGTGLALL